MKSMYKGLALLLIFILLMPGEGWASSGGDAERKTSGGDAPISGPSEKKQGPSFTNVSVHDPNIVKAGSAYYVFGSHIEAAKSAI
ncbi:hypothetical protein HMSSN139_55210 [Paenibacillus sp. HMSSN-139]|nr:hypothetical protein HMSSN139_55210 [Paenibacillus sp. HMSSN-139]